MTDAKTEPSESDRSSVPARVPITDHKEIVLAHGSGGKLSQQLIEKMVLPQFQE